VAGIHTALEIILILAVMPEQNAFERKRIFTLTLWFDASLRFLPIPANRKTL
jgi:hypothetical protein